MGVIETLDQLGNIKTFRSNFAIPTFYEEVIEWILSLFKKEDPCFKASTGCRVRTKPGLPGTYQEARSPVF